MRKTNYLPFTLLYLCVAPYLYAQKASAPTPKTETLNFADSVRHLERITELGFTFGGLYYLGDLAKNDFSTLQDISIPVAGIFIRKHLIPNLALRANLQTGKLSSKDRAYPDRDYRFSTNIHELSVQAEWDIFGKRRYRHVDTLTYDLGNYRQYALINKFRRTLLPYVFVGGGAIMSQAKPVFNYAYAKNTTALDRIDEDKRVGGGLRTKGGILVGGGLNFDLSRKWLLGVELGARTSFDDYIDGISVSGSPKNYDWYWVAALNLSYRFGVRDQDGDGTPDDADKCPEIAGLGRTKGCPDADNDGISDKEDECPRLAGILALAGCPIKDADNDGIQDVDDLCPKDAGLPEFKGCPDTDGDGIEDKLDECATAAGLVEFKGCPDTDGDGIEDRLDACPKEKGPSAYYRGCPVKDTDGDGVEDKLDVCLTTPGKVDFKGCPDTDNDGVEDALDLCPTRPGMKDNKGCPVIEKKDIEKLKLAVKAVKFETGKAVLKPESSKIMGDIADIMVKYPDYLLRIEGHTDNVGKEDKNQLLSEQRAKACADFLTGKGVAAARLLSAGFGSKKPLVDNKTAANKAQNRRVEFNIYLPQQ